MITNIIFYMSALILLIISYFNDKKKTKQALKKAYKSFMNLLPALIPMVLFVGVLLTIVSPELIGKLLGDESGGLGVVLGILLGSFAFMPSFVAFNLGDNLLQGGAGYMQVAAFVSSLMAVGVSSLTVELKYFNKKMTLYRNILALIASILFTIVVGMVI